LSDAAMPPLGFAFETDRKTEMPLLAMSLIV
jgi:hypothetical protein